MAKNRVRLDSEDGSTLLVAMIVVIIVTMSFVFISGINAAAEKQIYQVRFRNQLNAFENRWRSLLTQPSTYADTSPSGMSCKYNPATSLIEGCTINPDIIAANNRIPMIGAGCDPKIVSTDPTMKCGFLATVKLDQANHNAHLVITAFGTMMKPVDAIVSIPKDILQDKQTSCPAMTGGLKPMFMGIDPDTGAPICAPLVKPTCDDPNSQYATGVDPRTGAVQCANFPNFKIACATDSYLSSYTWDMGGPQPTQGCATRPDPITLFAGDKTPPAPTPPAATPAPSQPDLVTSATPDPCATVCKFVPQQGNTCSSPCSGGGGGGNSGGKSSGIGGGAGVGQGAGAAGGGAGI